MPCRRLTAKLMRKNGFFVWVVACPYCQANHWMDAGAYTVDPRKWLGVRTLKCGHLAELVADAASLKRIEKQFGTTDCTD